MSFTSEVKDELARVELTCPDCVKAELAALIRIEGTLTISAGQPRLEITTETVSVARTAIQLLHSAPYELKTELMVRTSVLHKAHNFLITVPAQPRLAAALTDLGVLGSAGFEQGIKPQLVERDCCAAAYLRGAFLAGGYIADPRGDFHFELAVNAQPLAEGLLVLAGRFGIKARCTRRHNVYNVYLKGAEHIITFLALTKAHKAALTLEEARVVKSVRNDTNRRVNAEIANQQKTIAAASDQIARIRALIESERFDTLPPSLQEVARLRLQYPQASIKELGEHATPPLSKSAVYHRIRRINELLE